MNASSGHSTKERRRAGMTLLVVAAGLDAGLGTYHLTHRGVGSGVTELVFAGLLVLALYFIFYAGRSRNPPTNAFLRAGLAILAPIAAVLFGLSIYHLTHEGPLSFLIELSLSCMLATAMYLSAYSRKS